MRATRAKSVAASAVESADRLAVGDTSTDTKVDVEGEPGPCQEPATPEDWVVAAYNARKQWLLRFRRGRGLVPDASE